MSTIKLFYYGSEDPKVPQRGEAEKIRLFLHETGMPFEDIALDQPTLDSMVKDGTLMRNTLPALQIKKDGSWKTYESSPNIMEVVAEKADSEKRQRGTNKYLGDAGELSKIRSVANMVKEFEATMAFRKGRQEGVEDTIKKYLGWFNDALKWNDDDDVRTDEYTLGKNFTFADLSLFAAVDAVACIYSAELVSEFLKLNEFHGKILTQSRLAIHISRRAEVN